MSASSTVLTNFVGSSYQLDYQKVDDELSSNLYYEDVDKQNTNYTTGYLRPVEGTTLAQTFDIPYGIGCRGIYVVTRGPDYNPQMYTVFDNELYRLDKAMNKTKIGSIGSSESQVRFAESGGVNSELFLANGTQQLFAVETLADDADVALKAVDNPVNIYDPQNSGITDLSEGVKVTSTFVVNMSNRLIINDVNNSQIFISRTDALAGGTIEVYDLDDDGNVQYGDDNVVLWKTVDADDYVWKSNLNEYQYFTALERSGDKVVAMAALNNQILYVFGNRSFDVWELDDDSEDTGYTFTNTGNGNNIGCAAPQSVARVKNHICWIGGGDDGINGIYSATDGDDPQKISNLAIDRKLSTITYSNAVGFGYSFAGHSFYIVSFPSSNLTLCYDFATGYWHNRSTRNPNTDLDMMWFPTFAQEYNGKIYLGTYKSNALCYLDSDKYTEWDGRLIKRIRRAPVVISNYSPIIVNEARIFCSVGRTSILQPTTDGHETPGYNPTILYRYSHDGYTWSSYKEVRMGVAGNYGKTIRTSSMGMGRYFVLEITYSDPSPIMITGIKLKIVSTKAN